LADVAIVLLFVAIGRSVHRHGLRLDGMISTTWPFAVGLAAGWIVVAYRRMHPASLLAGVFVTVICVIVAMVLRVSSGQGTAVAFIFVSLAFLGACMTTWRLIVTAVVHWHGEKTRRHHNGLRGEPTA
jgi:uncharacterized membrane protein (UPF0136 family)